MGVIEYGYAIPDPLDPDLIFGSGRNVVTKTHLSTGQVQDITPIPVKSADTRVDRTEPLLFAPHDPHRMYYTANRIYESLDRGQTWRIISPDLTREIPGIPASVGAQHSPKVEKTTRRHLCGQRLSLAGRDFFGLAPMMAWSG